MEHSTTLSALSVKTYLSTIYIYVHTGIFCTIFSQPILLRVKKHTSHNRRRLDRNIFICVFFFFWKFNNTLALRQF